MKNPTLALVIPCYNEEEVIETTVKRLLDVMGSMEQDGEISNKSFIYLVNDGSIDSTWQIIQKLHSEFGEKVRAINFSRNFGNQRAILAGLLEVRKYGMDCCITLDADLQQDENKIIEFVHNLIKTKCCKFLHEIISTSVISYATNNMSTIGQLPSMKNSINFCILDVPL